MGLKSPQAYANQPIRLPQARGIVTEMHAAVTTLSLLLVFLLAGPASAVGTDYRVHTGDVLNIQVFGEQALSQSATVLTDGTIGYPLIGRQMITV